MKSTLQLTAFNMNMIKFEDKGPCIALIGKRNTGKSFIIKDLLYHHKTIPYGQIIAPSEEVTNFYTDITPSMLIHFKYNSSIVEQLLKRQRSLVNPRNPNGQPNIINNQNPYNTMKDARCFLIMDDCLYDHSWTQDELIRFIFMNGRHYKIMYILTMQYPLGIRPELRTNIDWVFILRENIVKNRRTIYDNYAGMFPTFEAFCQTMDQCTEKYECLVINNNSNSNKLTDQIFWYKASEHPNYHICHKEYWDMDRNLSVTSRSTLGYPTYDPSNSKRKNGQLIHVSKQLPTTY